MKIALKIRLSAVLLCALLGSAGAQEKTVPVAEEGHHQLVLENEYTRVFHVVVAPKDSTLVHEHDRDYVYVMIGSSQVEATKLGGSPTVMKLNDGDVKFTKAPLTHKVTNVGETPFVNLTIEVKKASTKAVCGVSWAGQAEKPERCGQTFVVGIVGQTWDLETDAVVARTWFMMHQGTEGTPHDAENPRLLVALTPLQCQYPDNRKLKMKAGDVAWIDRGVFVNVSETKKLSPRFVVVYFK
jgi:quercetin dioxygenase-like cupin family protein